MDTPKARLKSFLEHINVTVRDSFESYGSASGFPQVQTTQKDTGLNLQRKAIEFAEACAAQQTPDPTDGILDRLAGEVEGLILAGNSMGVISGPETDQLVRELYDIKENR